MKNSRTNGKVMLALIIFSLIGQVAWVVENMYFNVFIYKMFNASATDISLMVTASAIAATLTTIIMGALSDAVGKRKIFICGGYLMWGISIMAFALIRTDVLSPIAGSVTAAATLGVTLVIIMDCVMTFFGSTANDACFNAWVTDIGDETNRGKLEGINAMMPLLAILVVFGGFMAFDLSKAKSWTLIYIIIGVIVMIVGILGFVLIKDSEALKPDKGSFLKNIIYSFRPSVVNDNKLLYIVLVAFAVFGISIQIFMPYLILYYEKTLNMANYVLIMAPAILLAAVITAIYGKVYDMVGFKMSVMFSVITLCAGYIVLYFTKTTVPVFIGSLLMMTGYLTGMAAFGAIIKNSIPENKAGQFQGIRIIGQVLIPGIIGPAIGAAVLKNADTIVNDDGTESFIPGKIIFLAALIIAILLIVVLQYIFRMLRNSHYSLPSDEEVSTGSHPTPQFARKRWHSLNGHWRLNGRTIVVPFPPQADLSQYGHHVGEHLTYEREFIIPADFNGDRVMLHFGAVDQVAEVYVNNNYVGKHEGGYLPFFFDITDYVNREDDNTLIVKVTDMLLRKYPYGKQCRKRGGMWYTPVSGIWQSVYIEAVPEEHIDSIRITPDLTGIDLEIQGNADSYKVEAIMEGAVSIFMCHNGKNRVDIDNPVLWTPDNPKLYHLTLVTGDDEVTSYFALRTVTIEKVNNKNRICLNGQPIFLNGVLDQGYYSDGIYTPANDAMYDKDIINMKELGFNMLRKHIKIEPESFYYACDRLGMLVIQDMVNNGRYSFIRDTGLPTIGFKKLNDRHFRAGIIRKKIFVQHMLATIEHLYNHPSIIGYTLFNEGWGQFDADKNYQLMKDADSTRFIDATSGWFAQKDSDVNSLHIYFKNAVLEESDRPLLVSESGGYSYAVEEHIYSRYTHYGYGNCDNTEELTDSICNLYRKMIIPGISKGLCGIVYTQLSDVEDEINGLYTYDRKVCKVNKNKLLELRTELDAEIKKTFL